MKAQTRRKRAETLFFDSFGHYNFQNDFQKAGSDISTTRFAFAASSAAKGKLQSFKILRAGLCRVPICFMCRHSVAAYAIAHYGSNFMITLRHRLKGLRVQAIESEFKHGALSFPAATPLRGRACGTTK